jgi:hypothetical protein
MVDNMQRSVGVQPAPAVEGDFASANPYFSVDAGQGALVSGPNGLTVGRFAWLDYAAIDNDNAPAIANNYGIGAPAGFVHREMQGLITTFLAQGGMTIPPGFAVTVHNGGDFWVKNNGLTAAYPGNKVYAKQNDGTASFGATGAPGTATVTGSIAAASGSAVGSINGNVLTVTSMTAGTIVAGAVLTGGTVTTGTRVTGQLSGSTGLVGSYSLDRTELASPGPVTFSWTYGILTVSAMTSGTLGVGDVLSGGTANIATIRQAGTGTGGTGTYYVDPTQTVGSSTLTANTTVETKWVAMSAGLPGELIKISDHPLG